MPNGPTTTVEQTTTAAPTPDVKAPKTPDVTAVEEVKTTVAEPTPTPEVPKAEITAPPPTTTVAPPTPEAPPEAPEPFGILPSGERLTGESADVIAEMERFPGLTVEAAIGNVIMRAQEGQLREPSAVVTTDKVEEEIDKTQEEIDAAKERQDKEINIGADTLADLTKDDINAANVELEQEYGEMSGLLDQRKETLEGRTQSRIDQIKEIFRRRKEEMKQMNTNRMQGLTIMGARTGRQRYAPEIQSGILSAEESAGLQRLADLDAQEQELIMNAEQSLEDNQFSLALEQINLARGLRQEKDAVVDKMYNRALTEEQFQTQKLQVQAQEKQDLLNDLNMMATVGMTDLKPEEFATFDKILGMGDGFTQNYFEYQRKAAQATTESQEFANFESMINVLAKIPEDKEITFPDGVTYTGLKEVDPMKGISSFRENDGLGNVTEVYTRYNPETGGIDIVDTMTYEGIAKRTKTTPEVALDALDPLQYLQAGQLSVEIFGKRKGSDPANVAIVGQLILDGMTPDEIQDTLRYGAQSPEFAGAMRDAGESIQFRMPTERGKAYIESLERSLEEGNVERALDVISQGVYESLGTEEARSLRGKERTVEFLLEIGNDLKEYQEMGGNTGIFNGTVEKIAGKIGKVKDPEMRKIATKIKTAIQQYRRAMSGVAFSVPESREYQELFPNIDKNFKYNEKTLEALVETFGGDIEYIYGSMIGHNTYDDLFKGEGIKRDLNMEDTVSYGMLPPLNRSYESLDDLLRDTQNEQGVSPYGLLVEDMVREDPTGTDEDILRQIEYITAGTPAFRGDLDKSIKGLEKTRPADLKKLKTGSTFLRSLGEGIITGFGSKYWKQGLDFVLTGGKGVPLYSPIAGVVTDVIGGFSNPRNKPLTKGQGTKQNRGFGNQVKIKTPDGLEMWISHLDDVSNIRSGQRISRGTLLGTQGNTGNTYGRTGVHLDITMKNRKGNYLNAKQVAAYLGDERLFT